MRKVYICSPYRAKDGAELDRNIDYAQQLTRQALEAAAEYTEVSELQNSNGKPQIIIQQAPIATGQQAEPQQTPPAAAGEPAGGLGEKEGVNNAD